MFFFFFNDTATTEIYTLSLHDALPICGNEAKQVGHLFRAGDFQPLPQFDLLDEVRRAERSEEHTSELQSLAYLVCRLLLEKKKMNAVMRSCSSITTQPRQRRRSPPSTP